MWVGASRGPAGGRARREASRRQMGMRVGGEVGEGGQQEKPHLEVEKWEREVVLEVKQGEGA